MGAHHRFGRHVYVRHWTGVAPANLRTRAHDLNEFIRNDLLLAGWTARLSCYCRPGHALPCRDFCGGRTGADGALAPRGSALDVLAFCGCCVGGSFHRRLRSGALREKMATLLTTEPMSQS